MAAMLLLERFVASTRFELAEAVRAQGLHALSGAMRSVTRHEWNLLAGVKATSGVGRGRSALGNGIGRVENAAR